jgi:PRTRC genetic system protein E
LGLVSSFDALVRPNYKKVFYHLKHIIMNFFKDLVGLGVEVQWALSITVEKTGLLNVTVRLVADDVKEKGAGGLPPMNFTGTAEEFDTGLVSALKTPAEMTIGFFTNSREYKVALEQAEKTREAERQRVAKNSSSKTSAKKAVTPKPPKPPKPPNPPKADPIDKAKRRKFDAIMQKVDRLEADGMYGQAIAKMPKETEFPEFKEQIQTKMKELKKKHGGFDFSESPDRSLVSTGGTSNAGQPHAKMDSGPATDPKGGEMQAPEISLVTEVLEGAGGKAEAIPADSKDNLSSPADPGSVEGPGQAQEPQGQFDDPEDIPEEEDYEEDYEDPEDTRQTTWGTHYNDPDREDFMDHAA